MQCQNDICSYTILQYAIYDTDGSSKMCRIISKILECYDENYLNEFLGKIEI